MDDSTQKEIKNVVDTYLKAVKTGDNDLFRRAFHPQALIIYSEGPSKPASLSTLEDFAKGVVKTISEHGKLEEVPRKMTIESYRNVGAVRVDSELTIGNSVYECTDFLNLVKSQGQWMITQKIYDMVVKTK